MTRAARDLAPALKDAYLRKAASSRGYETVELTFHVLRRALGRQERDADRILGFRFRGVRSVATEALRWDRDAAKWGPAKVDWLGALARDPGGPGGSAGATGAGAGPIERPIVNTATLESEDLPREPDEGGGRADRILDRWRKAAESALWLRGQPANLDPNEGGLATTAPVIFELTAEVILANGWNANARLFIAADAVDIVGSKGPTTAEDLVRNGEVWTAKWRDYWVRRRRRPELPEESQFEWMQPEDEMEGEG